MDIGSRIRTLRESAGLTQLALAKILNIQNSTLSQYESGYRTPSDDVKIAIANYFDVSIDYLVGRTDKKEKPIPDEEDGLSEVARRFMPLVDRLTPEQQGLLLAQLQAWTEQNQKQALAAQPSDEGKVPKSDF